MIIDAHTHLGLEGGKYYHVNDLLTAMKKGGVTHGIILANSGEKLGISVNSLIKEINGYKNLFAVGNWHEKFSYRDSKEFQSLMKVNKIRGVKIYLGYDQIWPTDKKLNTIYNLCQKYDYPVIFHTGLFYPSAGALLKYAHPLPIDELAVKRPKLKIIIAHSGYPWTREAAAVVYKNDHVYADLSGFLEFESLTPFNIKHFTSVVMEMRGIAGTLKKFLFGTDFPLASHADYVRFVKQLPITKEEKEYIFWKNALALFRI